MSKDLIKEIQDAAGVLYSDEQVKVIEAWGSPLSVNAAAGSGKTSTMLGKALYDEVVHNIKPYQMLIISFTNKAVQDIEGRYKYIRRQLGWDEYLPQFSTFHSFFRQLLQLYPEYQNKNIISGTEYKYQLTDKIRAVGSSLNTKADTVDNILNFRGYLINKCYSLDGLENISKYSSLMEGFDYPDYLSVVKHYQELKEQNNQLDFDDLQGVAYLLLRDEGKRSVIEDYFKSVFRRVIIDEYQDISPIQSEIINHLVNLIGDKYLVVIGDDDQCIYRFRGSEPSIITNFEFEHLGAKRLFLSTNYRCIS